MDELMDKFNDKVKEDMKHPDFKYNLLKLLRSETLTRAERMRAYDLLEGSIRLTE